MTEQISDFEQVIRPKYGLLDINWKKLKEYHELLLFLALREIEIRYKQTVMGASWAVLQLLFTMIMRKCTWDITKATYLQRGSECCVWHIA